MEEIKINKIQETKEDLAKLLVGKIKKVNAQNNYVKQVIERFCEEDALGWLADMTDVYDLMTDDGTLLEFDVENYLNDKVKEILTSLVTWNRLPDISDYIKNAKFGDKFKLRNGDAIAVFVYKKEFKKKKIKTQYHFVIEDCDCICAYTENGNPVGYEYEKTTTDIIEPYKEEVDVDKMEKEALKQWDFVERLQSTSHNRLDRNSFILGYGIGYRKARKNEN